MSMSKKWRSGTRSTIMHGEDTTFVVLFYGDDLVKELRIVHDDDLSAVLAAYDTTANALNLIKLTPSTIAEVAARMEKLFPALDAEQKEFVTTTFKDV